MESPINKETENLWIEYYKTRDSDLRNQIILKYIYLVKHVVNRMWGSYSHRNQMEDMISCGVLGLIDAIERYDISRGVKFETYAYFRIRGEIIDQIRKNDWIPKNIRIQAKKAEQAALMLEEKLGRQPSEQEIAEQLAMRLEDFHRILLQLHTYAVVSLDEHISDAASGLLVLSDRKESPERLAGEKEMKEVLVNAIETLSEKERAIVSMYYFEEMNLKEIGAVLGVSESRVSQIHTKALMRMKNRLTRHKEYIFEEDHS